MSTFWSRFRKIILVARPISWPNTAYPFAATYIVLGGPIDWLFLVGTLYFLFPYNLLMYGVNDVFDYESDIKNPRKGGIEGMREQRALHPTILKAALWTNLPILAWLFLQGSLAASLSLGLVIFMVVAYSVKGLRFKERPFLDSITSSSHFVGPMLYAAVLLGGVQTALPYLIAFFCWGMASHAFGAVQDIIPDRQARIASIATVIGARRTVWFAWVLYVVAVILVATQGWTGVLAGLIGLLYIFNIVPYMHLTDKQSAQANAGWRRFIKLNYVAGFLITMLLIVSQLR